MMASGLRGKASLVCPAVPKGARGIGTVFHTLGLTPIRRPPPSGLFAQANKILQRNIPRLTRLLGHPPPSAQPVSLNRVQHGISRGIASGFSFPTRMALSRPLKAAGMPRAPTLPRPVFEVGLGTVRRFASHSTFQHVVQNTSIAARAFWEVDWDIKPTNRVQPSKHTRRKESKSRRVRSSRVSLSAEEQFNRYFPVTETSQAAVLQIALPPTPSTRIPLGLSPETVHLLPLRAILDRHDACRARAEDVCAIFSVLDANDVWDRGASIQTWGDPTGLCVELRIHFSGWSGADVVSMLGPLSSLPGCCIQHMDAPSMTPVPVETDSESVPPLEFMMPRIAINDDINESNEVFDIPIFSSAHWDDVEPWISSGTASPTNSDTTTWSSLSHIGIPMHTLSSSFLDHLQQLENSPLHM